MPNKKFVCRAIILSILFLIVSTLCPPASAGPSERWDHKIAELDFLKPQDRLACNEMLTQGSILSYCKTQEKLLPLAYEELQTLVSETQNQPSLERLNELLQHSIPKPETLYYLPESFYVDNTPLLKDAPFYSQVLAGADITAMVAHAEQIYVDNLKLSYGKNNLRQAADDLWQADPASAWPVKVKLELAVGLNQLPPPAAGEQGPVRYTANKNWSWLWPDDQRHDYFISARQVMKHYPESHLQPQIYRNTVLVRNAYKVFCLALGSGELLWSLGPENNGQEHTHTFRHPHQNTYGNDFLLAEGVVFSELNNRLTAIDVTNITQPVIQWTRGLGEYTLCAKPVLAGDNLVCGLVNARGEVWFCGFNRKTGERLWDRYLGSSAFLGPACSLAGLRADRVIIATNHGVLVCLDQSNGRIIWLKKYIPHRYSLGNYWWKGYYKDTYLETGSLPYDTQFLLPAENGLLYYKPRESDYFYCLNASSGETVQKFYVDPSLFYVLGAYGGKAAFLQQGDFPLGDQRLIVANLLTGEQLYTASVPRGNLMGVLTTGAGQIAFKIDADLYCLDLVAQDLSVSTIPLAQPGWLLAISAQAAVIGQDRMLTSLGFDNTIKHKQVSDSAEVQEYLDQRRRISQALEELASELKPAGQAKRLLEEMRRVRLAEDKILAAMQKNLDFLSQPVGQAFLEGLNEIYGQVVVTYQDVQMTLNGFLNGAGLLSKTKNTDPPAKSAVRLGKDYKINTGNTVLLAVNIIKGDQPADFYILLNSGQIVCVGEKGDIRWEKKIFFGSLWQSDAEFDKDWHLYSDDFKIYLYENTLIINDQVNLIAVDVHSGKYLWSMTNDRATLNHPSQLPALDTVWSYEARLFFMRQIMIRTQFLNDRLIVSHRGKLYALDPRTGYAQATVESGLACVMDMLAADGKLYIASHIPHATIKVFDSNLSQLGDFSAPEVGENENAWPQLITLPHYLLLHIKPQLLIFNKTDGRLVHTQELENYSRYYIEPHDDGFIVIAPFLNTSGWRIKNDLPEKEWIHEFEPADQRVVWDLPCLRSGYYLMAQDSILNFARRQDDYWLVALDLNTGALRWETKLEQIHGRFHNLSGSVQSGGKFKFILTCLYTAEDYTTDMDVMEKLLPGIGLYAADLDSVLFCVDTINGKLLQAQRLPSVRLIGFPREDVTQTQNYYQYNEYRTAIRCVAKNKDGY